MCAVVYQIFHDFAGPIATIAAAATAVIVTYRLGQGQLRIAEEQKDIARSQMRLADLRLKHDIFDRRFVIYQEVQKLLIETIQRNDVTEETIREFVRNTDKSVFMFDQDFIDYLILIRTRAFRLRSVVAMLSDVSFYYENQRAELAKERADLANWFAEQFEVLVAKCKPFLALDSNTASRAPEPT